MAPAPPPSGPDRGRVDPDLLAEYGPDLELWHATARVSSRATAEGRARLARLSDDYRAADVVRVHGRGATAEAYRVFARQVGLDPDRAPLPPDAAARAAVVAGRLASRGPVSDVLLAVAVTSGVGVLALDARTVDGPPGLRPAEPGERLGRGRRAPAVAPGTIVVADAAGPVSVLFADPPRAHDGVRARTVLLVAPAVPGVDPIAVSEAIWTAARFLDGT